MPTNPAFDAFFQDAAARLAQNKDIANKPSAWAGYKPVASPKPPQEKSLGDNLGQGLIDFLSTGSYAVAGVSQRIGESVNKLSQGDTSNVLADLTGVGFAQGITSGIQNHRTWSDNLKAMGADDASATGWGLALDIVLDPTWLIPGGAIAKGATATARGIGVASRLTKEGIKLTPEIMKGVQATTEGAIRPGLRNLPKVSNEYGILSDVLKPSGQKISVVSPEGIQNFYQGIKQANIENYSEWIAARAAQKQTHYMVGAFTRKRPEYRAQLQADKIAKDIAAQSELGLPSSVPMTNLGDQVAETVSNIVDDSIKTQKVPNDIKDAGNIEDAAAATVDKVKPVKEKAVKTVKTKTEPTPSSGSIYTDSRETLSPARIEYQKQHGLDTPDINFAAVKASEKAPEMAKVYEQLVSDPTNPAVISAYKKFVDEVKQQYKYLTENLGIKIEYVKEDPYNVKNAAGEMVPDSRLMMDDILKNKRLQVRDSVADFATNPHPVLTAEENNLFRAVHDFFGHAASGRGFAADGEEAAWMAHSVMFSPEARRVMTTETRGQNSYYNFYKKFAEQKAALFPEEYTLLPAELDIVTGQALTANSFFGRLTNTLSEFSDIVLDDLGLVQTPIKGSLRYTPEAIEKIKTMVDSIVPTITWKAGTEEHAAVVATLQEIVNKLGSGLPETVATVKKPKDVTTLKVLQQVLDTPVQLNSLLSELFQKEGKLLTPPPAFKATQWEIKKGKKAFPPKPDFKLEILQKYFSDDELLANPKKLGIAMGTLPPHKARIAARKTETSDQAYIRYQDTIWDEFRARNIDKLKTIAEQEKAAWDLKHQIPESEVFTKTSAEQLVGMGKLPENFPAAALTGSMNGKVMSTLGKLLENVDFMIKENKLDRSITNLMFNEFKKALTNTKKLGIKTVDMTDKEFSQAASQLLDTGLVKNYADAKIAISGKADAFTKLAKQPEIKVYVKDRSLLRKTSVLGKGQKVPLLERMQAGLPLDKAGDITTEKLAAKLQVANWSGATDNFVGLHGSPITQFRMVTDTRKEFTGRSVAGPKKGAGSAWAEQSGVGEQQLAGLQAVRDAIGAINTGIKAKEFLAMPEQASLLSNVMTSIGIKVAEDASPEMVFKQFQKEALPAFNDIIKKIESAAKSEAIIYQARAVFRKSAEENISIMKAIDAVDPGDIQRSVVKFTEDAIGLVDDFCALNYAAIGGPKLSATEFLQQVAPGISKGIIYG